MIRFSRSEDFAILIAGTLAASYRKRLIPLSEIASEYAISPLFLRNIARELRDAGVITATEGKNGGYSLIKDPKDLKMREILSIFSSKQHLSCCAKMSTKDRACPKESYCFAGNIWRQINKEFLDKVYNLSLQEFLDYQPDSEESSFLPSPQILKQIN